MNGSSLPFRSPSNIQLKREGKRERGSRGKYDVSIQGRIDSPVSIKHSPLHTYKPLVANLL